MRRTAGVHVNGCTELRKSPSCASMVKMYVAEKDMANVVRRKADFTQVRGNIVERRLRTGIEKSNAVVCLQRRRRHNARSPELASIENVNFQAVLGFEAATMYAAFGMAK